MEINIRRNNWLNTIALLLVLPTAWFIFINLLNEAGSSGLYNASQPVLERMGIKENLGWNINLLILWGPLIGFLLTVFQVLKIKGQFSKEQFEFHFTFRKKWFPLLVTVLSGVLLVTLFVYLLGENL
jgi:hypothetical protein